MGSMNTSLDNDIPAIAVIGLAFEFPDDTDSAEEFWQMIYTGRSASTDFPTDRLNIDAFYHPDVNRPSSIPLRGGHFLKENLGAFDAPFFSISPEEAACMDPQHRRMLEVSYHALENAGIPMGQCVGTDTAVYTGCFTNDYLSILQQDLEAEQRHAIMGVAPSMLANRVSWFYDFKGTSMNLDSACSSSLVALHLACQDLKANNCSMALVGGANLVYHPNFMKMMTDFNFLSKDSRSWSFDSRANGYARGEGHAVLVLKRLSDALQNGDTIRAVIRNTGSNQDGRTPGITQPNGDSQVDLIRRTYAQAGLDMHPTRFFEAHGTGTPVGDPIEANAIGVAFSQHRSSEDPLYIGAVKANIGHLEGCSGLAGVIKTILVLESGIIPPIAGFSLLNPKIQAERFHLRFPVKEVPWPVPTLRRACVNSFGFGGTNAIAILDDAHHYLQMHRLDGLHQTKVPSHHINGDVSDASSSVQEETTAKLLVWSAPDKKGAERLVKQHAEALTDKFPDWASVSYTLAARRTTFPWRSFAVINSQSPNLASSITASNPTKVVHNARVAYIFTGQGAQYHGMGAELLSFPAFLKSLTTSDQFLSVLGCSWSAVDVFRWNHEPFSVDTPEYSQILTSCLQIALVDLLKSLGISPSVVLGHSSGEIAAAYASGAISHSSAVKVAFYRGTLSGSLAKKTKDCALTMMAVGISRAEIAPYLERLACEDDPAGLGVVEVGCVNSPKNVTLTGPWSQLSRVEQWLAKDKIFTRRLQVPIAYHHSRCMSEIADEYLAAIGPFLDEPRDKFCIPMISSVTGNISDHRNVRQGKYWVQNLTSTVEFERAFTELALQASRKPRHQLGKGSGADTRATHLLEVGPHGALRGPIREILQQLDGADVQRPSLTYIPSLVRKHNAAESLLKAIGQLWCAGIDSADITGASKLSHRQHPVIPELPPYPFDHGQIHWREGRLSRNLRFRDTPRHDLLGTRNLDWNPRIAQWRNVLRLADVPWLKDHTIGGQIVFPAAGMLVVAMEALNQIRSDTEPLQGILIRDASFSHAITFSENTGSVETQFTIVGPVPGSDCQDLEFRLFIIENENYIECCNGFVRAITEENDREQIIRSGPWKWQHSPSMWIRRTSDACLEAAVDVYSVKDAGAIQYGPCFQTLSNVRFGTQGQASARLSTDNWQSRDRVSYQSPGYIIHPTTLDGIAQLLVPAISCQQRGEPLPAMMPTRIGCLWIRDASEFRSGDVEVAANFRLRGYRGATGDIVVSGKEADDILIVLNDLETTFIGSAESTDSPGCDTIQRLCHQLVAKPHVHLMTDAQMRTYCTRNRPEEATGAEDMRRKKAVALMYFIKDTLARREGYAGIIAGSHFESYVDWMKNQVDLLQQEATHATIDQNILWQLQQDKEFRQQFLSDIEFHDAEGQLLVMLGRKLFRILSMESDPLELMFEQGLLHRYYEEMLGNDHHVYPAEQFLDILSHNNPSMKILEVGAGTGAVTLRLLEQLCEGDAFKCATYDYTDISPAFFASARSKFEKFLPIMDFRICDIAEDPVLQGFEPGSYDLIIASHVLHATKSLQRSLFNVRRLLKPEGRMLLLETTNPDSIRLGFIFGLLADWWAPLSHETLSMHSPCLPRDQWDTELKAAGFSGLNPAISGQDEDISIIITTCAVAKPPCLDLKLVIDQASASQLEIANHIAAVSERDSCESITLPQIGEACITAETVVVFLLEIDSVLLHSMSAASFKYLNSGLLRCHRIVWITRDSGQNDPHKRLVDGFSRALMSEDSSKTFATLALHTSDQSPQEVALMARNMALMVAEHPENVENVFSFQGQCQVSRIVANHRMNKLIADADSIRHTQAYMVGGDRHLRLHIRAPGQIETLEWRDSDGEQATFSSLKESEVLVQTRSIGLSRRDYEVVMGWLDESELGIDFSGIVVEAGSASGFCSGDRVFGISPSAVQTIMKVNSRSLVRFPSTMDFTEAASFPTSLWVAYHALKNIARLAPGDNVLICQASGCIGQMAVQLARKLGAKPLLITASKEKAHYLENLWGVPAADIIQVEGDDILAKIMQRSRGRGVDVVLGNVKALRIDFDQCLAPFARVINTTGNSTPYKSRKEFGTHLSKLTCSSINMVELLRRKPDLVYEVFQQAVVMAFGYQVQPPTPILVFHPDDSRKAFSHFQNRHGVGKCVIELREGDVITEANVITREQNRFAPDCSYVVAGGFGGLGRGILHWMAHRGARHLIVLSRSGPRTQAARSVLRSLEELGVSVVTPSVDISNLIELEKCVAGLRKTMPPIRGCVQATVALRDNLWENMTLDDWNISIASKVTGSWNLHVALPTDLDFFVLLSSVNGLFGNRSQANYSAGNTFKDALAHHRISRGQKAVSIDLGLMVDQGLVAEDDTLLSGMRRIGHLIDIRMDELLALMDHYCDPSLPILTHEEAQIIVGIESPAAVLAKGVDLHHSIRRPIFSHLFAADRKANSLRNSKSSGLEEFDYANALRRTASEDEAVGLVHEWFKSKISKLLGISPDDIDMSKPGHTYGIDSLVSIDLKNWIKQKLGADIQIFNVLGNISLEDLSRQATLQSSFRQWNQSP